MLSSVLRAPVRGAKKSTASMVERNPGSSVDVKKQPKLCETCDKGPADRGSSKMTAGGIRQSFLKWQSRADTARAPKLHPTRISHAREYGQAGQEHGASRC